MKRFPGETEIYRAARDELLRAETDLRASIERVAESRKRLPLGGVVAEDYTFERVRDGGVEEVRLSELFAEGKPSLAVYSYMYGPDMESPCPMCTSLIDGLDAMTPHVTDRMNLAVVAKSEIGRIMDFAVPRGWEQVPILSSAKNDYDRDYLAVNEGGYPMPMMNVFVKRDDGVHHFWGSELLYAKLDGQPRHVDLVWPLWNLFDLTPEGRGADWYPKLHY